MVHRTDIAGWIECSMGQASPGVRRMCHPANGVPIKQFHFSEPPPVFYVGGNTGCRLLMTAAPTLQAIHAEALGR